jgi:hypothetical protein
MLLRTLGIIGVLTLAASFINGAPPIDGLQGFPIILAPQWCMKLVEDWHALYNAESFSKMYEMTVPNFKAKVYTIESGHRQEHAEASIEQIRQDQGRFVRLLSAAYGVSLSARSWFALDYQVLLIGEFEKRRRHEQIHFIVDRSDGRK